MERASEQRQRTVRVVIVSGLMFIESSPGEVFPLFRRRPAFPFSIFRQDDIWWLPMAYWPNENIANAFERRCISRNARPSDLRATCFGYDRKSVGWRFPQNRKYLCTVVNILFHACVFFLFGIFFVLFCVDV